MGLKDAAEMLEVAKADNVKLERVVKDIVEMHVNFYEMCTECGHSYPCDTILAADRAGL